MVSTVLCNDSRKVIRRIVHSQRLFKGVKVGAIHDNGYLVLVRTAMPEEDCWFPIRIIRKIK